MKEDIHQLALAAARNRIYDEMKKLGIAGNEATSLVEGKKDLVAEAVVAQQKVYQMSGESVAQKTKNEHTELYKGYVEAYNVVSAKIDAERNAEVSSRSSEFRSLKLDETYLSNAIYLHELYFANCFDPKSEVFYNMLSHMRLERDFGSFEDWQKNFVDCALSAREGWVVCAYSTFLKKFVNFFVDGHDTSCLLGAYPVIVVDVWTHSRKDFANSVKDYVYSQMREFDWNVIEERFQRAEKIAEALK